MAQSRVQPPPRTSLQWTNYPVAAAGGLVVVLAVVVAREQRNLLRRPTRAATARLRGVLLAVPVASRAVVELF